MDLKVTSTQFSQPALGGVRPGGLARAAGSGVGAAAGDDANGFSAALRGALQSVSAAQNKSQALQREVQLENPAVSLEETMVAIQKAQIGFQAAVHVRNRLVQAYSDIMNMQV